jgi:NDP-sugar pyrophosphorylase family protein
MQMVILCGGLATRLGHRSLDTPKSMIRIQGKPFLAYQLEFLKQQHITDIILCVGHLSEQIQDFFGSGEHYGVTLQYSEDGPTPLGPMGALKKAEPLLQDMFFTLYGDSYVFVDFKAVSEFFRHHKNKAVMVVYHNNDKYDSSNLVVRKEKVIQYNGVKTPDMTYIDYGVSLFRKHALLDIPYNTFYATKDLYSKLVYQKEILAYEVTKRFYHIGTPEALQEFTTYIKSRVSNVD